jgi:hypothetical protein
MRDTVMRASVLVVILTASPAFATSYGAPIRRDVYSPNGRFVLDVNPETKTHTVYNVRDRAEALWSFSAPVWQAPFFLSNDGTVVVELEWRHVKIEHLAELSGITFRNRQGIFREHRITDLCPDPPKTQDVGVGPIGDFWRTWYTEVDQDDEIVTLRTTRGSKLRFRTSDGEIVERGDDTSEPRVRWVWVLVGVVALGVIVGLVLALARRRVPPGDPVE